MGFAIKPIAYVHNSRKDKKDDFWGEVISEIELVDDLSESALEGIEAFSHLEIIFYFDQVASGKIQYGARHPRDNSEYPKVGIFAQRGKNRPNKLGLTVVKLIEHNGKTLKVQGLDAIDGTPVIDIKPVMREFMIREKIKQPDWSVDLMKRYWD